MTTDIEELDYTGPAEYTYRELLDLVVERGELIITMEAHVVDNFKHNLSKMKTRDRAKQKSAGIITDTNSLSYTLIEIPGDPVHVKVHIRYGPRHVVRLASIELPDNTF